MIRTARLLLVTTMALTLAGVGAVQASSADPQPNQVTSPRSQPAMGLSPRGDLSANDVVFAPPSAAWTSNGGRLDVFQALDTTLAHRFWTATTGWSEWLDQGAPATGVGSGPAVTWAPDTSRLDVFVRGDSDGHLYQKTFTASGWSEWTDLGGVLISGPSATSTNGGRIDVFVIGTDFRLYQKTWLGSAWTNWVGFAEPGAGIGSDPSATWVANGSRIDVFVTGLVDGALYQLSWLAGVGWTNWTNLSGVLVSGPGASWTNNGGRIDVFGVGTDLRLYQKTWLNFLGWTGWVAFDPPAAGIGSAPSVTWVANGSRIDVVVVGETDGHVYQKAWSPSGWTEWVDLG